MVDGSIAAAGDVDTAVVTLRTASGKLCQISNSRHATYGYDQRIEAHGDACGHCFTAVPTQRRVLIQRGASIEGCEACGVLLYAAE